jgi:HPt (histidine-containing phosphotransfer) domain-containing protein
MDTAIDFSYLKSIAAGRDRFYVKVLTGIARSLSRYPMELAACLARQDQQRLRETAHAFKSSAVYLNHPVFSGLLVAIETSGEKQVDDQALAGLVNQVAEMAPRLKEKVEAELAKPEYQKLRE